MRAIIRLGGHQYVVQPDQAFMVDRLEEGPGNRVTAEVLFLSDGDRSLIGTPTVPGASVELEVLSHARGEKIRVFKQKRRKNYRRTRGARAALTQVRVRGIHGQAQTA